MPGFFWIDKSSGLHVCNAIFLESNLVGKLLINPRTQIIIKLVLVMTSIWGNGEVRGIVCKMLIAIYEIYLNRM